MFPKRDHRFFIVLINRSTGEILGVRELPSTDPTIGKLVEQSKNEMIKENWQLSSANTKFFTGFATSLESLLYSYPEIYNVR